MSESGIFNAAVKLPRDQRSAYLDQACGANADLRRELDSLLEAHDTGHDFLSTADYPPQMERPGQMIGPYKLMEQIGKGAMGLVFVAEQQQPIRRKVALKVIKPGMDSREVVARFEAERQALALMDHPNIAKVLDAGTTDSGRPFFVMELVKGVPITEYCDQNQLAPADRLKLFSDVCQAVQHAHTKGVIHRDIKPSNVLVTVHDGVPVAKVIDFGVAKALGQQLTERTIYTQFTQIIGTPLYMSPEQAQMSGIDVDTRSDIYSLGVLLYELLTGTTPFEIERLKKAAFDEVRRIIREEEPPKPSTRLSTLGNTLATISMNRKTEPRKLPALVRGDLDWIVMKALDKDRTRRYETASELGRDVHRYLRDEPVLAGPPGIAYRTRKSLRRHRKGLLVALMLLVCIAISAIVAIDQWKRYYFAPRAVDLRAGAIPYEMIALDGHVALRCRSLTLIFLAAPDKLIGTNHWWSGFQIPFGGVMSVKQNVGAGDVSVIEDCDNHVNREHIKLGAAVSYDFQIVAPATQLSIGGQSFDLYGEPRVVKVHNDGSVE